MEEEKAAAEQQEKEAKENEKEQEKKKDQKKEEQGHTIRRKAMDALNEKNDGTDSGEGECIFCNQSTA